VQRKLAQVVSF